ncbi:MAG: flagellar basal body-associated FliL family protein [Lachnospiraceae bacterium]|nr:flagellar basal body-associated FliL family protein [Lachnospiraceae bacterium]
MKKNLLTVLILALLIVNIVLTSIMMISVTGTNKKTAQLVNNIATVMDLELTTPGGDGEAAVEVSLADTEVYNLESSMTIPLAADSDGSQAYMMCEIGFSMNTKGDGYKTYGSKIAEGEMDTLIKDTVNTVIGSHTEAECRSDMEGLKEEILAAVQDLFQSDFIYKVSISEVKFG